MSPRWRSQVVGCTSTRSTVRPSWSGAASVGFGVEFTQADGGGRQVLQRPLPGLEAQQLDPNLVRRAVTAQDVEPFDEESAEARHFLVLEDVVDLAVAHGRAVVGPDVLQQEEQALRFEGVIGPHRNEQRAEEKHRKKSTH